MSKTTMEIFEAEYPIEELLQNPFKCAEALGWLYCTLQYNPSLEAQVLARREIIRAMMTRFAMEGLV